MTSLTRVWPAFQGPLVGADSFVRTIFRDWTRESTVEWYDSYDNLRDIRR